MICIVCAGYTIDGEFDIYFIESYYSDSISNSINLTAEEGIEIDEQFWMRLVVWAMEIEAICFTIVCFVGIYRGRRNILTIVSCHKTC